MFVSSRVEVEVRIKDVPATVVVAVIFCCPRNMARRVCLFRSSCEER